jgi:hypothetical protein
MLYHQLPAAFNNSPVRLSKEERKHPAKVVNYFFGAYHLHEIRQQLGAMTEVSLTKENSHYDSAKERDSLLWLYYQVESLIEAAWIIDQQKKNKK